MSSKVIRRALAVALACAPSLAHAQQQPHKSIEPKQPCNPVTDTMLVPTQAQIRDRQRLGAALDSIARAHGIASPAGILFVDVDGARQGKVFFIDANLDSAATQAATRRMADYLSAVPAGHPYQALIRLNAPYVAPAVGKLQCSPTLANGDTLDALVERVEMHHPEWGHHQDSTVLKRATLRLVVNRDGGVSYVEVMQPTGDPEIDPYLEDIASRLRFLPAKIDGVPYDVRFRFIVQFAIR